MTTTTAHLGDKTVHRIGFGAMQLAGPGVSGPPTDPDNARRPASSLRLRAPERPGVMPSVNYELEAPGRGGDLDPLTVLDITPPGGPMTTTRGTTARDTATAVGRALLALAAASALLASLGAIGSVVDAAPDARIVETWRALGLAVFAGLFALLAWRPQTSGVVWLLVVLHKAGLTVAAVAYAATDSATGTTEIVVWDGGVTLVVVAAWFLTRRTRV